MVQGSVGDAFEPHRMKGVCGDSQGYNLPYRSRLHLQLSGCLAGPRPMGGTAHCSPQELPSDGPTYLGRKGSAVGRE